MIINNQTQVFISVSSFPGNFGATVFNELFNFYSINAIYIPRKAPSAEHLVNALRELNISGCSISIPLKEKIIPHINEMDEDARKINSINTLTNSNGILKGFNTDYFGCLKALENKDLKSILIYGSGSVVNSLVFAAKHLGITTIDLCSRNQERCRLKSNDLGITANELSTINLKYDLLINATPSGSDANDEVFNYLSSAHGLFDLRVSPSMTLLETKAEELGMELIRGITMSKWQLAKQFEIYVGIKPDIKIIEKIINEKFLK